MWKQRTYMLLTVIAITIAFTACTKSVQNDYHSEVVAPTQQEETLEVPTHIDAFAEGMKAIVEENGINIVVGSPTESDSNISIGIMGTNDSDFEGIRREIDWFADDNGSYKQSFWLMFNTNAEAGFAKEVLTACIMYLGNNDFNTAWNIMQDFVNTYDTITNSELLQIGDYAIHIGASGATDLAQIYFDHVLEIENQEIDEGEYAPIDYDMCQAVEMNKGSKFVFSGFVVEVAPSSSYAKVVSVQADDGNVYEIQMRYAYPVEIGSTYNFWVELFESDSVWASGANLKTVRIEPINSIS